MVGSGGQRTRGREAGKRSRGATGRMRIMAMLALLGAVLASWVATAGSVNALPTLGANHAALPADTTLADVIVALDDDTNVYGTGTDFVGAFSSAGLAGLDLLVGADGAYATDAGTSFTLAAEGQIAGSNVTFDVVVHAEVAGADPVADPATLVVALRSSAGTLRDLVPYGAADVADVSSTSWGLTFFQGGGTIDTAPPGGAAQFLADALGQATLTLPLSDGNGGKVGVAASLDSAMHWDSVVDLVGAQGANAMPATGTIANTFADLVGQYAGTAPFAALGGVDIEITVPATSPTWTAPGLTTAVSVGSSDWTFRINYDLNDQHLQIEGKGATWDVTVSELFTAATTFSPEMFFAQNVTPGVAPETHRVGGTIGAFTIPNTTNDITISANFSRQDGSTFVADFDGVVDVNGTDTAAFEIYIKVDGGTPSVTLTGAFPDVTVAELQTLVGTTLLDDPAVPSSFRTTVLTGPVVSMDLTAGSISMGATGRLEQTVLQGDAAVGVSLMMFAELDSSPTAMIGVAPSVRPIGVDDPEGTDEIMLSQILDVGGDFDFAVYDPDDPTLGLGVIFSTSTARLGGDDCAAGAAACVDRQDVTTNVAQWLMPLWGFDGSNEAVYDSTDLSGICLICSFRDDFQPATAFTVPQGLTVAGTVVMPQPIGSADDVAARCTTSPGSDDCEAALGLLGSLGLGSRVTVTGSVPIPGTSGDLGLTLGVGLLDASIADRPTWLHDAGVSISVTADATQVLFGLRGSLDVAVKQGLSVQQASDMFGAGSQLAADNTLQPVAPGDGCARGGVEKVERDSNAGFTAGDTYCHDLLRILVDGSLAATADGVSVEVVGDLQSILDDGSANPDGWRPMGFDRFALAQVTATVNVEAGAAGTTVTLGGAVSGSIETTPNIPFSAALQLQFQPGVVVFDGMRLDVAQVSIDNMIEIYEWLSGDNVSDDIDLPGVSLRNLSLSINATGDDIDPLCIGAGFALSGDLYITDDPGPTDLPTYDCDADPQSNTFGQLSPAPAGPCTSDQIADGCTAGIRLDVNDRGIIGDAFLAEFNAGPIHIFAPGTGEIPDNQDGRGVSIHVEITRTRALIQLFGGAALGGTESAGSCTAGAYCDAWASGDFNAKLTAGLGGVEAKFHGRMQSGLPFLSVQMLVAGSLDLPGATEIAQLFAGTIPDSGFEFHVELANTDAAPDLDFASSIQSDVNSELETVVAGLNDALAIAKKLEKGDAAGAKKLLEDYDSDDPALVFLIDLVADIQKEASDENLNAKLDWFLDGIYFGVPGSPNIFDLADPEVDIPRCDGLNYGYGPTGKNRYSSSQNYYPYNFCFLAKPFKIDGACSYIDKNNCTLDDLTQKLLIEPIMKIVIAGIDLSIDATTFAQDAANLVLDGELLSIDCASFDVSLATSETLDDGFEGSVELGLFLTVFAQDIGAAFSWDFGADFATNAAALATAAIDALSGEVESTCWTIEEVQAFFGDDVVDPTEPPAPAEISSVAVVDGVTGASSLVVEGNTATATITYDKPLDASRVVLLNWGDGSADEAVTLVAGQQSATRAHVYDDDGAAAASTEVKNVVVTDGGQTITVPVSVVNADPVIASITASASSINEDDSLTVEVSFTDAGLLDTHEVSIVWDDGSTTDVTNAVSPISVSHQYLQNPLDELADIEVTVTDKDGGSVSSTHQVDVLNVAPTLSGIAVSSTDEGVATSYTASWSDPGTLDRHALTIDWDNQLNPGTDEVWIISDTEILVDLASDGLGVNDVDYVHPDDGGTGLPADVTYPITTTGAIRSVTVPHTYRDDDPTNTASDIYDVVVDLVDIPDGDVATATYQVTVNDVAPLVSRDVTSQTVQYSDELGTVTVTATDVSRDVLMAAATITDSAGVVRSFDVAGLTLDTVGCASIAGDRQECTWEVNGIVADGADTYTIAVTVTDDDTLSTTVTTELIVIQEDAVVDFPDTNPIDVRVDTPGGDSPAFVLRADISELVPDIATVAGHPGDIGLAQVRMTLSGVGPGTSSPVAECVPESADPASDGYAQHMIVVCAFDDVEVNTYHVQVEVDGDYWVGSAEDVVTISDPSLGFTTGGGWFYWPGTDDPATGYLGDRTNFGYTMKYNRRATNVQGSFLMIRHLEDGRTMRIKTNSVEALAIGTGSDAGVEFGWASFTSKATWKDADWLDPVGNHQVVVYVEDRGEPEDDNLWVELRDRDGLLVPDITLSREAYEQAPELQGGNIVVPHTTSSDDGGSNGNGRGNRN